MESQERCSSYQPLWISGPPSSWITLRTSSSDRPQRTRVRAHGNERIKTAIAKAEQARNGSILIGSGNVQSAVAIEVGPRRRSSS
jgi:hypothetical protein